MTTVIRRATAPDVVNLYRLVSKQDDFSMLGQPDEARALAFVLDLINNGYVVVAENSGRLVGSIGFAVHQPPPAFKWVLDGEWFFIVPSYRDSGVGADLLDAAIQAADKHSAPIRMTLNAQIATEIVVALQRAGFASGRVEWIRERKLSEQVEQKQERKPRTRKPLP